MLLSSTLENQHVDDDVHDGVLSSSSRAHPATGVCLKGTLFTPLSRSTSTQSLNVQLRRSLDLYINLVAGFNLPNVSTRQKDLDIVVIRCAPRAILCPWLPYPQLHTPVKIPRASIAGWSTRWCRAWSSRSRSLRGRRALGLQSMRLSMPRSTTGKRYARAAVPAHQQHVMTNTAERHS